MWSTRYRRFLLEHPQGSRHALAVSLTILEAPYAVASGARNWAYNHGWLAIHRVPVPVFSIGNLTVGGTGKTPLIIAIAKALQEHGDIPAILSRGYGLRTSSHSLAQGNDEAREIAQELPDVLHRQNRDRVQEALNVCQQENVSCLLLDDGFQHRRLHRDLDIVLIDALCPFGADHLLPRGLLRERLQGLRRAHVAILTRASLIEPERRTQIRQRVLEMAPHLLWCESTVQPVNLRDTKGNDSSLESLHGKRVAAFAGIGNPDGFRRLIQDLPVTIADFREYPDHHPYSLADRADLATWIGHLGVVDAVLCTCKDLVKFSWQEIGGVPLQAIRTQLTWLQGWPELMQRIVSPLATTSQSLADGRC